ncbi:MAG: rhamnulokinase family protein [Pseudolysinimonas sp.]
MVEGVVAAVDLGATSGRVMLGTAGPNVLRLREVARFPNGPMPAGGQLHWDITRLRGAVLDGLALAVRDEPEIASFGIDSWGCDYALVKDGAVLGEPFHYRDPRNAQAADRVTALVGPQRLYERNGLQFLPFNTLYQLAAENDLAAPDTMLLIPDLFAFWLTGRGVAERTNASTTGLLTVSEGEWDDVLIGMLGLPRGLFPELVDAGTTIGPVEARVARELGAGGPIAVTAVGSHDTASAVVAVPATTPDFAYISCGTWGLVGVETDAPILSEESRLAGFTNEGGVDGRVRYLHNVMGLWLLSECVREWERDGSSISVPELVAQAEAVTEEVPVFDADDETFLAPGEMPARIEAWLRAHDLLVPGSRPALVRSILLSLAGTFARTIRTAASLSGKRVAVVHVVGGGSQNALLCRLIADATGLPVVAGPVEATAIGNVLVQARAAGYVAGDLETLRALVVAAFPVVRYEPRGSRG